MTARMVNFPMFFVLEILGKRTLSRKFPKREMEISVSLQFPRENCPFPIGFHAKTIRKFKYLKGAMGR